LFFFSGMQMNRWPLLITLFALSVLPALALDEPTISVTGSASIDVKPDQVVLTASVESRGEELSAAKLDNDQKIAELIEFLKSSKIDVRNVQTDFIEIDPIYLRANKGNANALLGKSQQPIDSLKPTGYAVRRGFNIRLTDVNRFEEVYAGLIDRGINRVSGIAFQTSELGKLQAAARQRAMADAKAKAELLVSELGAQLSGVQSIQDTTKDAHPALSVTAMGDPFGGFTTDPPPLVVGEIQITAQVDAVFRMSDTDFE
jgi:uncharacterized protein YggE